MKAEWRRFAPIGLYISIIAALVSAGLFIVQREFNLPLQISLGMIIIGLALFAVLDPSRVRESLTGRQVRYGSNSLVMSLAFIGILVVINFLIYKYPQRWDLTADKSHTLSPETIQTLKTLPGSVHATAFFTSRTSSDQARTLLEDYKFNSQGRFDYEFVDPDSNPVAAQSAKITKDGTIVLTMKGIQEQVTTTDEQDMTSGLIRLISPGPRAVYFLTGHGERDPMTSGETAYSQAKTALETKNYSVKTLNLLADPKIPDDAKAIVIAGPEKPVSENEVKLIQDYVNKGGSLIVMEEPLVLTSFGESDDPLADYLAKDWNVTLGKDMVIDTGANPPSVAIANEYGSHSITQKLQQMVTVFPTARSVDIKTDTAGTKTTTSLVKTSSQSWAETNFTELKNNQVKADQGQDVMGPISVAAAVSDTTTKARVVVIGDADFASDTYFSSYGNGDLFINSVDWAAQQDSLINLTPKSNTQRVVVSPQRYTMGLILLGSIFVLPGSALIAGIFVWIQRRRRG